MKLVNIIGIGMGNPATLTVWAQNAISEATFLVGAKRMVDGFAKEGVETCYAIRPNEIVDAINNRGENENIAVLMSGDVGFFSGTKKLKSLIFEQCDNAYVSLIPGISSLQYFSALIGTSWDDAKVITMHGRNNNPLAAVLNNKKTFFLLSKENTPATICKTLTEAGLGHLKVFVGANLSYDEEFVYTNEARQVATMEFDSLSVMMVFNDDARVEKKRVHGLDDQCFTRGKVPMTKEEVRSVSISKLNICQDDIIYDVGAGTGSVAIEMALASNEGFVYAIETNPEAVSLLEVNKENFGLQNLKVVSGMAPEALVDLPAPDKVFVGGSKGNLKGIFQCVLDKNPNVRITVNAIALETLGEAIKVMKEFEMDDVDIVQIATTKTREIGSYTMMNGTNPVFIITGQRRELDD